MATNDFHPTFRHLFSICPGEKVANPAEKGLRRSQTPPFSPLFATLSPSRFGEKSEGVSPRETTHYKTHTPLFSLSPYVPLHAAFFSCESPGPMAKRRKAPEVVLQVRATKKVKEPQACHVAIVVGSFVRIPRAPCRQRSRPSMRESAGLTSDVSAQDILKLLKNQEYRCALTGRRLTPDSASLDHMVPISRGGTHCLPNAQVLHKDVNRAKGTLTNEEFIALCREVAAHVNRYPDLLRAASNPSTS